MNFNKNSDMVADKKITKFEFSPPFPGCVPHRCFPKKHGIFIVLFTIFQKIQTKNQHNFYDFLLF